MTKRLHVAAARALLTDGPDAHLRYAALELRLGIEAIAYDKLRLYAPRLPPEILKHWQPPQLFRALEEFEPHSTNSFTLRMAPETEYGVPGTEWRLVGEQRSFKLRWLRKSYNKLGSLLHNRAPGYDTVPEIAPIEDPERLRSELSAICDEVERVASSTIDASMATIIDIACAVCGSPIIRNLDGAKASQRADCLQRECGAQHHLTFADDTSVAVHLIATEFECIRCNSLNRVENRKLDIGYQFTCTSCSAVHTIEGRQWQYSTPEPSQCG